MKFTFSALFICASVLLFACPKSPDTGDGGNDSYDAANPPTGDCSGGCASNQYCDVKTHSCLDGCGGCDAGTGTCMRNPNMNTFQCVKTDVACDNQTCAPGQIACIGGGCSCLGSDTANEDTCALQGKLCQGHDCRLPLENEECIPSSQGGSGCANNNDCWSLFGVHICLKPCANAASCGRGESCLQVAQADTVSHCLPQALLLNAPCIHQVPVDGGGTTTAAIAVGNECLLQNDNGVPTETTPTGNCTYALYRFKDQDYRGFITCRPPGLAGVGAACSADWSPSKTATQCASGLECAPADVDSTGLITGQCMTVCNASPQFPGFSPTPACAVDQSCVNIYRAEDTTFNSVLGVCTQKCNIFDASRNTCANIGGKPASCIPAAADGRFVLSFDGSGICMPQKATLAAAGAVCSEPDSFRGAACANSQICTSTSLTEAPKCYETCDTSCSTAQNDGGFPARCATEPNDRCATGKTCTRVNSNTGATVGFCL